MTNDQCRECPIKSTCPSYREFLKLKNQIDTFTEGIQYFPGLYLQIKLGLEYCYMEGDDPPNAFVH